MCRVGCVLFIKPGHHTPHISELKYAPNTAHFRVFLEIYKTTYSLHIDDNLSQIQRETNAFLLLVTHNAEIPPFPDWPLRHKMFFFFVGLKNRVNLVYSLKPWYAPSACYWTLNVFSFLRFHFVYGNIV